MHSFVAKLAAANWDSEVYPVPGWVQEVSNQLIQDPLVFQDESLASIVGRYTNLQGLAVRVSFLSMVNNIQVLAKCKR